MSKKVRCYHATREVIDTVKKEKHTILVYGELVQTNKAKGFLLAPVTYNKINHREIRSIDDRYVVLSRNQDRRPTRQFNFGWAICDANDEFDLANGIRIAKRRFSDSPMTTTDVRFFSDDMIRSILENELDFIERNLESKYLPDDYQNGCNGECESCQRHDCDSKGSVKTYDELKSAFEDIALNEVVRLIKEHKIDLNDVNINREKLIDVVREQIRKTFDSKDTDTFIIKIDENDEEKVQKVEAEELPTVEFEAHKEQHTLKHGDFVKFTNGYAFMYGVVRDSGIGKDSKSPYINLYWELTKVDDGWIFRTNETIDTREIEFLTPREYEDDLTYKILYEVFGVIWDRKRKSIKLKSF